MVLSTLLVAFVVIVALTCALSLLFTYGPPLSVPVKQILVVVAVLVLLLWLARWLLITQPFLRDL